jgi:hypothetical protein
VGLLAAVLLPLGVGAQGTGDLDTSFGGDGKVTTGFQPGSQDFAVAVALQPDGKLVVAGTSNGDFALARWTRASTAMAR